MLLLGLNKLGLDKEGNDLLEEALTRFKAEPNTLQGKVQPPLLQAIARIP